MKKLYLLMPKEYNYIYDKLVEGNTDIIGQIAYSIYKKDKIDYIKSKISEGIDVTDEVIKPFNEISALDSSIESYKMKSEIIIQAFIDNTIDDVYREIETEVNTNYSNSIKQIVDPLIPNKKSIVLTNIWTGVISSFIFAALLTLMTIILQTQGSTFQININPAKKESDHSSKL